ncbi:hypothetical protein U9M48_004277 [Paspalum notatum var. saurae]|uniref:Alpha/beta hydrolase fold-3 domain-containing protein n=1 Tax=Paspalum notatum var. saurae TaxID=547442 RepID=A0AAQ3SL83_PASNO
MCCDVDLGTQGVWDAHSHDAAAEAEAADVAPDAALPQGGGPRHRRHPAGRRHAEPVRAVAAGPARPGHRLPVPRRRVPGRRPRPRPPPPRAPLLPLPSSSSSKPPPAALPVIVFFHGGGFAFLSASSPAYDAACRRMARYASAAVLSVDYRRAPEHRFPAPYEDGHAALRFLDDPGNHRAFPVPLDVARCFLAGDSAGGNIAHHVARRYARDAASFRNVRVAGLVAVQPFFGGEERTAAELRLDGGAPIVNMDRADWMWRAFLPPGADRTHEAANFASPDAAAGLDSPAFPPVLLAVGGFDPLQDWQRRYAEMLASLGKDVRVAEYPDAIHAFYLFPEFDDARDFMIRIAEFVAESAASGSGE